MQEQTSIRISKELLQTLNNLKSEKETYEDIIWEVVEPYLEDSDDLKSSVEIAKKEHKNNETMDFNTLKEKHGF